MLSRRLSEALRFSLVGGIGFAVDAGLLFIFTRILEFNPFFWRLFSFLSASTVTWSLHRNFTFDFFALAPLRQWLRFAVFNGLGGLANFLIYTLLILHGAPLLDDPMVAVTISSMIAFFYNFTVSKYLVFKHV